MRGFCCVLDLYCVHTHDESKAKKKNRPLTQYHEAKMCEKSECNNENEKKSCAKKQNIRSELLKISTVYDSINSNCYSVRITALFSFFTALLPCFPFFVPHFMNMHKAHVNWRRNIGAKERKKGTKSQFRHQIPAQCKPLLLLIESLQHFRNAK